MRQSAIEAPKFTGPVPTLILKTAVLERSKVELEKFCILRDIETLKL